MDSPAAHDGTQMPTGYPWLGAETKQVSLVSCTHDQTCKPICRIMQVLIWSTFMSIDADACAHVYVMSYRLYAKRILQNIIYI